jgi:hypothetical protein
MYNIPVSCFIKKKTAFLCLALVFLSSDSVLLNHLHVPIAMLISCAEYFNYSICMLNILFISFAFSEFATLSFSI